MRIAQAMMKSNSRILVMCLEEVITDRCVLLTCPIVVFTKHVSNHLLIPENCLVNPSSV